MAFPTFTWDKLLSPHFPQFIFSMYPFAPPIIIAASMIVAYIVYKNPFAPFLVAGVETALFTFIIGNANFILAPQAIIALVITISFIIVLEFTQGT